MSSLQEEFAGVAGRGSAWARSAFEPREAERQVEGLFDALLSESFAKSI